MMLRIYMGCLLLLSISGYGQEFTVSGYLRDATTGEELLFANISVLEQDPNKSPLLCTATIDS